MPLTDEERKLARAYNMGYTLSHYEPRLLDRLIKSQPKNQFVKYMAIGRDHAEFHAGIPGKNYNRDFKNGYYNGRTLATHEPDMIGRLMSSKGLSKDYKRGVETAKIEHSIRSIQQKMNNEPKMPSREQRRDEQFKKGFNLGYRYAGTSQLLVKSAKSSNEKYANYLDGIEAGIKHHDHDLAKLREKDKDAVLFPDDLIYSSYESALLEHKTSDMSDVRTAQYKVFNSKEFLKDAEMPKWLQDKNESKSAPSPDKGKSHNKNIDHDR